MLLCIKEPQGTKNMDLVLCELFARKKKFCVVIITIKENNFMKERNGISNLDTGQSLNHQAH